MSDLLCVPLAPHILSVPLDGFAPHGFSPGSTVFLGLPYQITSLSTAVACVNGTHLCDTQVNADGKQSYFRLLSIRAL